MNDPRGKELIAIGEKSKSFLCKNRNRSILIHGFSSATAEQIANLKSSAKDLEEYLCKDFNEAKDYLKVARSINFSIE